jgi:antitoxin Phd
VADADVAHDYLQFGLLSDQLLQDHSRKTSPTKIPAFNSAQNRAILSLMKGGIMFPLTIGFTEARKRLSEVTEEVNRTGHTVVVLKNNRPWVAISPVPDALDDGSAVLRDALDAFRSMREEAQSRGFATEAEIEAEIAAMRACRGK